MRKSLLLILVLISSGCREQASGNASSRDIMQDNDSEIAVFGAGCFWCIEPLFESLTGVEEVVSGYAGGKEENPTYREVCSGQTGHAEVIRVRFNPSIITYRELLEIFWQTHDPTTLNRQGADVGTQYRSVVFYTTDAQRQEAEHYKEQLNKSGAFNNPVVTEISALPTFYLAEDYHQDYYSKNPGEGYCTMVIRPKIEKFKKAFSNKLKN